MTRYYVTCEEDLRDDPMHDFAELYLEDVGRPSLLQVQDKEKPKTPTAWLGVEPF